MAYIGAGITRFNTADDLTVTDDAEIGGDLTVTGSADINGGTIDGTTIGGASAGAGTFTGLTVGDGHTIGDGGGDNLEIVSSSTENILLKTSGGIISFNDNSGNEYGRFDSSGNLGIGTSSPAAPLEVSTSSADYRIQLTHTSGQNLIKSVDGDQSTYRGLFYDGSSHIFRVSGTSAAEVDSSANLKFNSGYGSVAVAYGCRVWVRFDGTTSPLSVSGSGGVSSVSDNGTGTYQINFSTTMPDSNYSTVCNAARIGSTSSQTFTIASTGNRGTNSQTINGRVIDNDAPSMAVADISEVSVAIFR